MKIYQLASILIADEPAVFAERVAQVFSDAALQRTVGRAARALMESRYDWPIIGARARRVYAQIVGECSQAARARPAVQSAAALSDGVSSGGQGSRGGHR